MCDRMMHSKDKVIPSRSCLFTDVATGLLRQGLGVRFYAKGWSMYPTIKEGEVITVEPVEPSKVKRGDIILYQNLKGLIAHRVVSIEKTSDESRGLRTEQNMNFSTQPSSLGPHHFFFLRGDGEDKGSETIEPRQILGKVVLIEGNRGAINPNLWKAKIERIVLLLFHRLKRRALRNMISKPSILFGDPSAQLK